MCATCHAANQTKYAFVLRLKNIVVHLFCAEAGDNVRLDVPQEAQEEIKQAKGNVFAMPSDPYW